MFILADSVDAVIGIDPNKHTHTHTAAFVAAKTSKHHSNHTATAD